MAKYINIPFATSGNKTAIPDTTTDGTVNYTDGFGADYARPLGTDPLAKTVDRETINQALYDYGTAIQQLQENGFFAWQSTKAGGYDIGAAVSYSGANYINTVAANTAAPDVSGWVEINKISAADILTELKTVDGLGSGLDAGLVRGMAKQMTLDNFLHCQDQKANTTTGGTPVAGDQTRTLNTVVTNTITGASLATDKITLPAGNYYIEASAPCYRGVNHKIVLVNSTDAVDILVGDNAFAYYNYNVQTKALLSGYFVLSAAKDILINHWIKSSYTDGLGVATSSGRIEIYTDVKIWKVD